MSLSKKNFCHVTLDWSFFFLQLVSRDVEWKLFRVQCAVQESAGTNVREYESTALERGR